MSTDKDRASSSSSSGQKDKDLLQTLLGNTLFQPQEILRKTAQFQANPEGLSDYIPPGKT